MAERKKKKSPNSGPYAQIQNTQSAHTYDESSQTDQGTPSIGSQPSTPLDHAAKPKFKIQGFNPGVQIYSQSTTETPSPMWTPQENINTLHYDQFEQLSSANYKPKVSFKLPATTTQKTDEKQAQTQNSSVSQILDELQRQTSTASSAHGDPEFIAMQDMIKQQSDVSQIIETDIQHSPRLKYVPRASLKIHHMEKEKSGSLNISDYHFDDVRDTINHADVDKLRNKYRQLKEKYIRLHKNYKKTKNLRVNNENLLSKNQTYCKQLTELQQQVSSQKNTIFRQNKHLLRLRTERDDFADVVEVQLQEKRLTEKYGVSPLTLEMLNSTSTATASAVNDPQIQQTSHVRSITTPLNMNKSVDTPRTVTVDEDDANFVIDSQFTMTYQQSIDQNDTDEDEDDDDEQEEKYVTAVITPGEPTPGGPDTKKAKFTEVDDITRNVERKYYSQSRSVLTSSVNPHIIDALWQKIIGEKTDDINIVEQSSEICDAWTINECECVQRLLFVLKYYSQWLSHKAMYSKRKSRATRDVFNNLPNIPQINLVSKKEGYTATMTEFINGGKLKYYNHVQLLNDFFHVKKYHISDTNQTENVFKHFVNEFGFCDVKHCTSFRRNHREKSFFGHHNRFRRKVYHLEKKIFTDLQEYDEHEDNSYELHEINIQQCLDMIHSTLIHDYHNTTTDNLTEFAKQLLKSPVTLMDEVELAEQEEYSFTGNTGTGLTPHHGPVNAGGNTNTGARFEYKQVISSVSGTRTARVSVIENPARPSDIFKAPPPSSPIPLSPQQEDPASLTQDVFSYGFGVRFSYWIREWPDFVQPQFATLRDELLENDIYRISAFEWDLLQHRAAIFMQTNHGIFEYLAKFKGSGNTLMKISVDSRLTINHLIALYTYTNYPNIRISFQKACLRTTPNETFASVLKRHEQIANWARLLYESVYLFGCKMRPAQKFYHILRSKIMLSRFSANLSCPTTMISNRKIVNNSNIVMEVENAHSRGTTYLDISYFSDVPNREERLFFFGDLAFDNIILKSKSHRHYIKSLSLFQKIVQGSYFYHTSLKKKEYQETIVFFMRNMMASKDISGGVSNYVQMLKDRQKYNDEDVIAENNIPLYMQHLFDYFCSKLKTLWINQEEFNKLQPELKLYLAKNNNSVSNNIAAISSQINMQLTNKQSLMGKFTKFLHFEYFINLKYCCTLHWEISGAPLRNFRRGEKIFGQEFRVSTIRLFPYIVKDSSKNDGQFRFGIPIKSMPKYLKKIEFRVDLYIAEIDYTFSAYSIIDERGTYWYSLFDSSKLRNFNKFTLRISFRLINLMVSNGQTHSFNSNQPDLPPKASLQQPRGGSLSIFKLENFRKVSGTNLGNVTKRISKKFQRNKNGGVL